jgi:Tfp pilus assembly protein PilV
MKLRSVNGGQRAGRGWSVRGARHAGAFTLLEVIIACTIFFLVAFAVLGIVAQGLAAARALQQREPDAGMLAAALSLTNKLEEGSASGDFEDMYPGLYPGYRWEQFVEEQHSNGCFRVDFIVYNDAAKKEASPTTMSVLFFRPGSPGGSRFGTGATGRRP